MVGWELLSNALKVRCVALRWSPNILWLIMVMSLYLMRVKHHLPSARGTGENCLFTWHTWWGRRLHAERIACSGDELLKNIYYIDRFGVFHELSPMKSLSHPHTMECMWHTLRDKGGPRSARGRPRPLQDRRVQPNEVISGENIYHMLVIKTPNLILYLF